MRLQLQRQLLLAALVALPLCAHAQTYKCKQADGKLSFQDQPCQGASTGSQIVVRPVPPSADPAEIERMKAASSKARTYPAQAQRSDDEMKARHEQVEARNRSVRCENARRSLGILKSQRPVYRYDNKGERQYVEDANRHSEIAAAQRGVADNCL